MSRKTLSIMATALLAVASMTLFVSCDNEFTLDDATGKVIIDGKRHNLSHAQFEQDNYGGELQFTMSFVTKGLKFDDEGCIWDGKTHEVYIISAGGSKSSGGEISGTYPIYATPQVSSSEPPEVHSLVAVEHLTDLKYVDESYGDDFSHILGYDPRAGKYVVAHRDVTDKSFDLKSGELTVKQNAKKRDHYKVTFNGKTNGHTLKINFNGEMDEYSLL